MRSLGRLLIGRAPTATTSWSPRATRTTSRPGGSRSSLLCLRQPRGESRRLRRRRQPRLHASAYYGQLVQSDEFNRSADWESVACRLCHSQRATLRTTTPGASMQYQFTGQSIALIGAFAGVGGSFEVYIDGVRQGTYSEQGTARKMAVVYQKRFATRATRVLIVVAVSGRVEVDALVTQDASCRC